MNEQVLQPGVPSLRPPRRLAVLEIKTPGAAAPLAPIWGVSADDAYVTNRLDLLDAISAHAERMRRRGLRVPVCLHITAHGNQQGIKVGEDFVIWADLQQSLVDLNMACGRQLLLCMSSCHGLAALQIAFGADPPFYAVIGARAEIRRDIGAYWNAFYARLADGVPLESAVAWLRKERSEEFMIVTTRQIQDALPSLGRLVNCPQECESPSRKCT